MNENEANITLVMKHFFEDLGLPQKFSFLHMKYHTIQFHLNHDRPEREDQTAISRAMFNLKKEKGITFCEKGLKKDVEF